jgi:hypothetical protein
MSDRTEETKEAARKRMLMEAEQSKKAFVREVKRGLGEQMVDELKKLKPPSKWKLFMNKVKKVLGI